MRNISDALCKTERVSYDNNEMRIQVRGGGSYVFQIGY